MFTVDDVVLEYVPISGLVEGESTDPIVVTHETPVANGRLVASLDDRLTVWGRIEGVGSYRNLATDPIDLSVLSAGYTNFEVYVEALSPIVGLERVPVSVIAGGSSSAGWLA